ncbi:MAG TPA: DUF1150 family protein [Dongiaceae bacterium]|jgi:hypothetical protein|nr:DUF1150 family protein [Dongiaceae bacterium]
MNTNEASRIFSSQDFAVFGMQSLAYLRKITVDGTPGFGIFAADGTQLAFAPSRALAVAAVREHDLEPVSVH